MSNTTKWRDKAEAQQEEYRRYTGQLIDEITVLVDALNEMRRELDRWRNVAAKLKQAVEIQTTVYTPDGFMSINGREAIQQFDLLDKQDIEE